MHVKRKNVKRSLFELLIYINHFYYQWILQFFCMFHAFCILIIYSSVAFFVICSLGTMYPWHVFQLSSCWTYKDNHFLSKGSGPDLCIQSKGLNEREVIIKPIDLELCFSRNPLVRLPLHLKFGIMSAHPVLALMVRLASAEGAWICASVDLLGSSWLSCSL
jgi:hypothetical protein